ncbi:MAG TPA: PASTA domain-containing protein [Solirubrobacteraceae bacterium]|nr:PASTA domain-containing protein [Solirubrobacteraceae bacterium]
MEDTSAPAASSTQPDSPGVGEHPIGALIVEDYVGVLAAEATRALRRAGLRPGLDRCHGYEEAQIGYVVAQQPPAGSHVSRNSIVTLHVAAPAVNTSAEDRAESSSSQPDAGGYATDTAAGPATLTADLPHVPPTTRRWRQHEQDTHSPPDGGHQERLPPEAAGVNAASDTSSHGDTYADAEAPDDSGPEPDALREHPTEQLDQERLAAQADELFAAGGARANIWSAVDPRVRGLIGRYRRGRGRNWLRRRSRSVKVLAVLFALWAGAWLLSELAAHSTHPTPQLTLAHSPSPASGTRTPMAQPARPAPVHHQRTRPNHVDDHAVDRSSTPQPVAATPTASTVEQPPPVQQQPPEAAQRTGAAPSPPAAPPQPAAPAHEQTQGGPFSP